MKEFTLLVNGADVDTGLYEYFPYADKVIADFGVCRRVIRALKEGGNPPEADTHIFGRYCLGEETTNTDAILAAHRAFGVFGKFSIQRRKKIMNDIHALLVKRKEEFINMLIVEGHPRKLAEWEFLGMEIGSSPETIDYYCTYFQKEIGRAANEILYLVRRPDGVVCLNPPANAPASNSYNGILVFLAGNTLIVRAPSLMPLSTLFLWKEVVHKALAANGAPAGTLNVIMGNSHKVMNEWLSSEFVNDIVHFGNSKQGFELGKQMYAAGKKPILELSGNDVFVVWRDADLETACESLLEGFLGSTQICMVPKIAVVHKDIYADFSKAMVQRVKQLRVSLPSDPETVLSPVAKIREFYEFRDDALAKGASLLCGGERVNYRDEEDPQGSYIRPALLKVPDLKEALGMKMLREEIFFPLMPLVRVNGSDDAVAAQIISLINNHAYGLRVSLWVRSPKYLRRFAKEIDNCGLLRINSRHVGFSFYLSTHGGTRRSGGPFGEMNYFWQKTSHLQGVTRTV